MKKIVASIFLVSVIALSSFAQAREVTLTTQMQNYSGDGAYLAIYLTDAEGNYQKTLWVAGKKAKYYKNLRDWARGSALKASEYDGMSGASIAKGTTFKTTVEVADALIDAGYEIRVDTAVEDKRDVPVDVRVPLTTSNAGKTTAGRGYIKTFIYTM